MIQAFVYWFSCLLTIWFGGGRYYWYIAFLNTVGDQDNHANKGDDMPFKFWFGPKDKDSSESDKDDHWESPPSSDWDDDTAREQGNLGEDTEDNSGAGYHDDRDD